MPPATCMSCCVDGAGFGLDPLIARWGLASCAVVCHDLHGEVWTVLCGRHASILSVYVEHPVAVML